MEYELEDIRPLKQITPSLKGGRPTFWHDDVPAMYACMLRHSLSEQDMSALFNIPLSTLKSWIINKESMQQAKAEVMREMTGKTQPDDTQASYDDHLEAGQVEAVRALRRVLANSKSDASVVQAANALLDRAKGKPSQAHHIQGNVSYTIISAIPAPPNSVHAIKN